MLSAMTLPPNQYCTACFSGCYPVHVSERVDKHALEARQFRMFT
jgi:hypothetical protein